MGALVQAPPTEEVITVGHGPRTAVRSAVAELMGTTAHVLVVGDGTPGPLDVLGHLVELEARWSRFRVTSELSRLNAAGGDPCVVGPDTVSLVQASLEAWRRTGGRFDPTVLDAVRAAGYDRSFDELPALVAAAPAAPAPGCEGVVVDPVTGLVQLPPGVGLDPGGIGKGLAADLSAVAAVGSGAPGVLVSVGGDLRVAGAAPAGGWEVELDHHLVEPARVNLLDGAVATSSTLRRRWRTTDGTAHHVIDPRTGRSADGPAVACSVVAAEAWWAEALATALLVSGGPLCDDGAALIDGGLLADAGALVTHADGTQLTLGGFAESFSLPRSN